MSNDTIHTVPSDDGWTNRRPGGERASGHFDTQAEAIEAARRTAERERLEHFIHGRDGQIRARNSYGNDPRRREG
jgi:hypothetical protein